MPLPTVREGIIAAKVASLDSEKPEENTLAILKRIEENQPQIFALIKGMQEEVEEGNRSVESSIGFILGVCCVYQLLEAQADCDDLEESLGI